jgi:dCMP deaminase
MTEQKQSEFWRPNWDEYFMKLAIDVSNRATCRFARVGCLIVANDDKRILGSGYNGAPKDVEDCLKAGCQKEKKGLVYEKSLNTGQCIGVHAEMNGLAHITALHGQEFTLYTTLFPCANCAKNLLPYKLKRIVYKNNYDESEAETARALLGKRNIQIDRLDMSLKRYLEIDAALHSVKHDVFSREERERLLELIGKL